MAVNKSYSEIINEFETDNSIVNKAEILGHVFKLKEVFEVDKKLTNFKEEKTLLKNLKEKYASDGIKAELLETMEGLKEVTSEEFKKQREKVQKDILKEIDDQKKGVVKAVESLKDDLITTTTSELLNGNKLDELPEKLKNSIIDAVMKQKDKIEKDGTDFINELLDKETGAYAEFIDNYILSVTKQFESFLSSKTNKAIGQILSDVNKPDNNEYLKVIIDNMDLIEKIEKADTSDKMELISKLKYDKNSEYFADKTNDEIYSDISHKRLTLIQNAMRINSFTDLTKELNLKNIKALAKDDVSRVNALKKIFTDFAKETITGYVFKKRYGVETNSTYILKSLEEGLEDFGDKIKKQAFYINEENTNKRFAVAWVIEEIDIKLDLKQINMSERWQSKINLDSIKNKVKSWVGKITKTIDSKDEIVEDIEKTIEEKKTQYLDMFEEVEKELDIASRLEETLNEELADINKQKEKLAEVVDNIEEGSQKFIDNIEKNIKDSFELAIKIKSQIEEEINNNNQAIDLIKANIELNEAEGKESNDLEEELKMLRDNALILTNRVEETMKTAQDIEEQAKSQIESIQSTFEEIQEVKNEAVEDVNEVKDHLLKKVKKYQGEIEDIKNLDFKKIYEDKFPKSKELVEQTRKDFKSLSLDNVKKVLREKADKYLGLKEFEELKKVFSQLKTIDKEGKLSKKEREDFDEVKEILVDYGHHNSKEAYESEINQIIKMKQKAYEELAQITIDNAKERVEFQKKVAEEKKGDSIRSAEISYNGHQKATILLNKLIQKMLEKFPNKSYAELYMEVTDETQMLTSNYNFFEIKEIKQLEILGSDLITQRTKDFSNIKETILNQDSTSGFSTEVLFMGKEAEEAGMLKKLWYKAKKLFTKDKNYDNTLGEKLFEDYKEDKDEVQKSNTRKLDTMKDYIKKINVSQIDSTSIPFEELRKNVIIAVYENNHNEETTIEYNGTKIYNRQDKLELLDSLEKKSDLNEEDINIKEAIEVAFENEKNDLKEIEKILMDNINNLKARQHVLENYPRKDVKHASVDYAYQRNSILLYSSIDLYINLQRGIDKDIFNQENTELINYEEMNKDELILNLLNNNSENKTETDKYEIYTLNVEKGLYNDNDKDEILSQFAQDLEDLTHDVGILRNPSNPSLRDKNLNNNAIYEFDNFLSSQTLLEIKHKDNVEEIDNLFEEDISRIKEVVYKEYIGINYESAIENIRDYLGNEGQSLTLEMQEFIRNNINSKGDGLKYSLNDSSFNQEEKDEIKYTMAITDLLVTLRGINIGHHHKESTLEEEIKEINKTVEEKFNKLKGLKNTRLDTMLTKDFEPLDNEGRLISDFFNGDSEELNLKASKNITEVLDELMKKDKREKFKEIEIFSRMMKNIQERRGIETNTAKKYNIPYIESYYDTDKKMELAHLEMLHFNKLKEHSYGSTKKQKTSMRQPS